MWSFVNVRVDSSAKRALQRWLKTEARSEEWSWLIMRIWSSSLSHTRKPDVTVVAWGEFGRTPRINPNNGRDHFPAVTPVVFGGGVVRGGQVIGAITIGVDVDKVE